MAERQRIDKVIGRDLIDQTGARHQATNEILTRFIDGARARGFQAMVAEIPEKKSSPMPGGGMGGMGGMGDMDF